MIHMDCIFFSCSCFFKLDVETLFHLLVLLAVIQEQNKFATSVMLLSELLTVCGQVQADSHTPESVEADSYTPMWVL